MNIRPDKAFGLAFVVAGLSFFIAAAAFASEPVINVEAAMAERAIGREDAPVTIIEYASMTCDHCAGFHIQVLPEVKKDLIETGRARLVYRDMPWDKFALKAAKMARCAPADKYFGLVEEIFKTHDVWAHGPDPLAALKEMGKAAGMDDAYLQACLDNVDLETAIVTRQQEAIKAYDIKGTPTFVFMKDGARQEHFPEFEEIAKRQPAHKH